MPESLIERLITLASGKFLLSAAEHDIAAVGQCSFGQGQEGVTAHDYCMPSGKCLEALEIVGQPIQQFVFLSYRPVSVHGGNDVYSHVFLF